MVVRKKYIVYIIFSEVILEFSFKSSPETQHCYAELIKFKSSCFLRSLFKKLKHVNDLTHGCI